MTVAVGLLTRWLIAPQELSMGVLTALLGGGYLLWPMRRGARWMTIGAEIKARGIGVALGGVEALHGINLASAASR